MGSFRDLRGERFGKLVVINRADERIYGGKTKIIMWECLCDCGNKKDISGHALRNGLTKSCGCLQRGIGKHRKIKPEDMIGKRFGKLVVKCMVPDYDSPNLRYDYWYCDCDCGTKNHIVSGVALRRERGTKSCGCYNKLQSRIKNTINITGEKYGHLLVLNRCNEVSPNGSMLWNCLCDCGNHAVVSSNALRNGSTMSCGCMISKNEEIIRDIFNRHHIVYKTQYYFDDLRSPITNWILKFDFAVFNVFGNLAFLLEYDGEQHELGTRFSPDKNENDKKFKRTQLYDLQKNQYCDEHDIKLYRISFKDKDKIFEIINQILLKERMI